MPRLYHPRALDEVDGHPPRTIPSAAVGERVTVDDAGTFAVDDAGDVRDLADAYDVAVSDLVVDDSGGDADEPDAEDDTETCDTVKADGEVCGRDLPCPYHSGE